MYQFTITATDNGTTLEWYPCWLWLTMQFPSSSLSHQLPTPHSSSTLLPERLSEVCRYSKLHRLWMIWSISSAKEPELDISTVILLLDTSPLIHQLVIDRETDSQLNLTITARLQGEPTLSSVTTPVTISVTDINDNRPLFDPSSYTLSIFTTNITTGQKLLTVFADDRDEGSNQLLEYNISLSGPTPSFRISTNGYLCNVGSFTSFYILTVTAWDGGIPRLNGSTIVTITVVEPIPLSIQLTQTVYHLNTSKYTPSGSHIGNVILVPIPQEFQLYVTFHPAAETSPSCHPLERSTHDYELRQSCSFTAEAYLRIPNEDPPVSLTATATVNVDVIDENDNTPEFMDFPTTISFPENQTTRVEVHRIIANDLDSGTNGMLRYEILNDVSAEFVLGITSGVLSVVASLYCEEQEVCTLNVLIASLGNPR